MRIIDYVDLGKYLRDVRESQNIAVEQAGLALHIRPKYLYDLESGNLEGMPGRAYLRGYIKNYAEYLRLDSREVLAEYDKLFDSNAQRFFVPDVSISQNMPSRNILWLCCIGLLLLYAYSYFAIYDHVRVENTITEMPEETAPVKMSDDWDKCLNQDDVACFIDLSGKSVVPPVVSPFMPEVELPEAAPEETPDKDSGSKTDEDNDEND